MGGMRLVVNGEPRELPIGLSVSDLVRVLELRGRIAVEVNGDLVPRSRYEERRLADGDRVEIVHAIGGGAPQQGVRG